MSDLFLGIIIGLLVGWNVLPQPVWAKVLWDKAIKAIRK